MIARPSFQAAFRLVGDVAVGFVLAMAIAFVAYVVALVIWAGYGF